MSCLSDLNRAFSLTWPASMQIYGNKRKCLHKEREQLPQDWFGTPPIWPPWRHVKTLHSAWIASINQRKSCAFMTSCPPYEVWSRGVEIWGPPLRTTVNDKFLSRKHIVNKCKMFTGIQLLELGALPALLQFDHKSSSSDDITLQQMEKREKVYRKRVCKFCTGLACE